VKTACHSAVTNLLLRSVSLKIVLTGRQGLFTMSPMSPEAKARRRIVTLVTLFYLLLIFEGSIRKWALTSYGQVLFFIRDPLVLAVYWLALKNSLLPKNSKLLAAGIAFAIVGLFIITLQAVGVASGIDKWPILAVYGWRNYFLYIPLPFIVGETFEAEDIRRIVKITALLAVPIAVLVLLQFHAAPDAPINVGFGASAEQQFRGLSVDMDHTRPMGTFTSDLGQKNFDVSCLAMLLSLWLMPASRRYLKAPLLIIATCAVLSCLAVGGSRSAMIGSGIVAIAAIGSALVLPGGMASARAVLLPLIFGALAISLYPIIFPEGYSTFMTRWNQAAVVEAQFFGLGVFGRALYGFFDFLQLIGDAPVVGYGLGLAGNASLTLGVVIPGFNGWAENDWSRHIVDLGPIIGVAFILYRISFVVWLGTRCLAGARRNADALPMLLFAYIGIDLLYGELTGHGTVNGYGWLFAGLCLASSKTLQVGREASALLAPPARSPRFANLMR
jgi:hypothetical protein